MHILCFPSLSFRSEYSLYSPSFIRVATLTALICRRVFIVWFARLDILAFEIVFVRRKASKAAELPCILETCKATCDCNHIDGDSVSNAIDTG